MSNNEEGSTQDWEAQAKYHQSEKDKLHVENQQLKQYEKIGKFLESRPDLVQNLMGEVSGQPNNQPERVTLKPDEFDPWEAYNDPSSASYKFRMQEMQDTINGAVDQAVGGIKAEQGRSNLRSDLASRGLNEEQMESFFKFAGKLKEQEYTSKTQNKVSIDKLSNAVKLESEKLRLATEAEKKRGQSQKGSEKS